MLNSVNRPRTKDCLTNQSEAKKCLFAPVMAVKRSDLSPRGQTFDQAVPKFCAKVERQ